MTQPGYGVGAGRLAQAVIALPYYRETNPGMTRAARHAISQVLADVEEAETASAELVLAWHGRAQ